jgi:hypothetical protein
MSAAAGAVAAAGARVAGRTPELPGGLDDLHETFLRVMAARASAGGGPAFVARLRRDGDRWDAAWADGLAASAADYIAFHRRRAEHQEALRQFLPGLGRAARAGRGRAAVPARRAADRRLVRDAAGGRHAGPVRLVVLLPRRAGLTALPAA